MAELNQEMIEDLLVRKRELLAELTDEEDEPRLQRRQELHRQLQYINRALGDPMESDDALVDQWERDLAEGRVPNLED